MRSLEDLPLAFLPHHCTEGGRTADSSFRCRKTLHAGAGGDSGRRRGGERRRRKAMLGAAAQRRWRKAVPVREPTRQAAPFRTETAWAFGPEKGEKAIWAKMVSARSPFKPPSPPVMARVHRSWSIVDHDRVIAI